MKIALSVVFCCLFTLSYSVEKADSTRTKLKAGANVSLNSNGIASIPAFSLGDPAIIASLALTKGRFSYEPVLAYGLDMKPWFIDNWLQYNIINRPAFIFRTGFNFSTFFSEYKTMEDTLLKAERYFALALTGIYKITPNTSLTVAYWNDRGQEPGTIKGHFFNLVGERTDISIGKHMLFAIALQLFYINYDGNNDGLFVSPKIAGSLRNVPFSLFFQGIQAIQSNIEPFPGFNWNIGLGYTL
jgi:hypothetical protein